MDNKKFKVILTDGMKQKVYYEITHSKRTALILAQIEAIKQDEGYKSVSCEEIE